MRVPLMPLSLEKTSRITGRFRGITGKISNIFPQLDINLKRTGIEIDADKYVGACAINSFLWGLLVFFVIFPLLVILGESPAKALPISLLAGFVISLLLFVVLFLYPGILAGKRAEMIEKDLVYALKDILLEVSAGASLYNAMVGIANTDYGLVSEEFRTVVKKVDIGMPLDDALEELALRTTSEYLRNSVWQIVNALKAGSNIEGALSEIVRDLTSEQRTKIKNYAQELNILSLLYMLFAVVLPTIATTIIIIVGPFLGIATGPQIFYVALPIAIFVQIALLKLIKNRRPVVHL